MAKIVLALMFAAAAVLILVQVLGGRGGPVGLELDSDRIEPGERLRGTVSVRPEQDLSGKPLTVDLVARRRFSSPIETADSAADYYHDTADLHRSQIFKVAALDVAAGATWEATFETSVPTDVPGASERVTNAPNAGGRTGTQPWTIEWSIEARVEGIQGESSAAMTRAVFRVAAPD